MPLNAKEDGCFICGKFPVECHHIFPGSRRKNADDLDLVVFLCHEHHNSPGYSAHYNKEFADYLKAMAQAQFEKEHSHEEWMSVMKKNYI